jgi:hypothetical protein
MLVWTSNAATEVRRMSRMESANVFHCCSLARDVYSGPYEIYRRMFPCRRNECLRKAQLKNVREIETADRSTAKSTESRQIHLITIILEIKNQSVGPRDASRSQNLMRDINVQFLGYLLDARVERLDSTHVHAIVGTGGCAVQYSKVQFVWSSPSLVVSTSTPKLRNEIRL